MVPETIVRKSCKRRLRNFPPCAMSPNSVRHVPRLLNEAGVRFVVVEGLPGAQIDGVCFWLSPTAPVIGMSMRFDRIDNFWFVLRHECAHVLHGHGKQQAIVDEDLGVTNAPSLNEEERIANNEAADFCVPSEQMRSFYLRKNPFFSESDVLAFSKRVKVHPGIGGTTTATLRVRASRPPSSSPDAAATPTTPRFLPPSLKQCSACAALRHNTTPSSA